MERTILGGIAFCLLLQLNLQFVQKINWDEFFYLSKVYDFQRGGLTHALQSFHVHLFGLLPSLGVGEIEQIQIGRSVMWLFEIGTLISIYLTTRCFASRSGSLLAVLAYVSSGLVLLHGTSFRADPLAASLMMVCICILVRSKLGTRDLIAFVIAATLATLVTIKIVLFAPALVGIALWRLSSALKPAGLLARLSASAFAVVALFGALFWVHLSFLPSADVEGSRNMMSSAWHTSLLTAGLFPRAEVLVGGALLALPQTILLFTGVGFAFVALKGPQASRMQGFALLALATPLASFIFYRNAFPYFLPFIFPPSMVLVGYAADRFRGQGILIYGLIGVMSLGIISQYTKRIGEDQVVQRETLRVVHKMFPTPVRYIDRCSMIPSFPKAGFFMSGWGLKSYLKNGEPIFSQILSGEPVPLLIINSPVLEQVFSENAKSGSQLLLPQDVQVLRQNYVQHWGPIWIAGKQIAVDQVGQNFRIVIPGGYALESGDNVSVDGRNVNPGDVLELGRGLHTIKSHKEHQIVLRWGEKTYRPLREPEMGPLFSGF